MLILKLYMWACTIGVSTVLFMIFWMWLAFGDEAFSSERAPK